MTQAESFPRAGNSGATSQIDFLAGGGEMGELIRAKDWSTTPLGPAEQWPQSLKTVVRIMLTSRQPIWIGWGPELIKLYNDPYRAIVGGKHPDALGQPASVVWREIWDTIEPRLRITVENNQGTYDESFLLIMERNGYPEETYYTFSYSPIPGDEGGVGGIICANTDDTRRIISERQMGLLRILATETADARTIERACDLSAASLSQNPHDLPFAMLYLLDQDKQTVTLAGTTGIASDHPAVPANAALTSPGLWPFATVLKEQKICVIDDLDQRCEALPTGAWKRSPHQAVAVPIAPSGQTGKAGVLIVGLNPFRLFDESYQGFIKLVANQIAASLGHAQAYEEERKRAEALAEIDKAKTLFFSNISHEFRTPLTLMLGPLEDILAEKQALSPTQREQAETIHRNALRLLKLVNNLLDFSRIEAGRVLATYEATDLAAMTADLASNFRTVIEKAGMKLTVDCSPLAVPVYVDHEMWEKIILNLLSNAFKYTLAGEITITQRQRGAMLEVSVKDTGVGIPAEELPHMFERFHRVKGNANRAGRTIEGTGIGLSLVQELVKLHGGKISVTSAPNQGSIFTFSLPLGTAHLPQERIATRQTLPSHTINAQTYVNEAFKLLADPQEEAEVHPNLSPASKEASPAAKILFADDNADMRDYVARLLRPRYTVQTVTDGLAALAAVREFQPDLVLADIMMPKMDGFELLQTLRTDPQTRTLPIILLSARAGEEAKIEGMQAGADDYLIKPFSARELLARVGVHVEMARVRKEAEARVQAERQRLHDLFMQAPSPIAVFHGPEHVFELANPQALHFLGTHRPLLGRPIREALPELKELGFFELLDAVYQTGQPFVADEALVRFDRRGDGAFDDLYFNFAYQPSYDATGNVDGVLVYANDVTEILMARSHLEESEKRFRTLAENIPTLVWMAKPDGWIYWYNSRWYEYTGTTLEQMQGWGWQIVQDPQLLPSVLEAWKASLRTGEPFEMVFPLKGADGVFHPFLTRAVPIRDEEGQIIHWFGSNTDITEQKRLEQQKGEFIGIASHELKTPVTSVKGYTQILERRFHQTGDERSAELLKKMDAQLNKLTALIRDLLDVTKIESGKLLFHPSPFDLNGLIKETAEEMQRTTTKHRIMLELTEPVTLTADRDRIEQVLTNLLTNAIKYSPDADIIRVKTVCTADTVIASVQDYGIGIPKDKQQHLFERFFRVEGEARATYPGLGLGLYISAEFIKRHHGLIWLEDEGGEGSTFSFSLPLV